MRPQKGAANIAGWKRRRIRFEGEGSVFSDAPASKASCLPNISMKLDDMSASREGVKPVHVLGNEGKGGGRFFEIDQRSVSPVRLLGRDQVPSPGIPLPNGRRVPLKGFGGGEIFGFIGSPKPFRPSKGRDSAVGGDPRPGQNRYRAGRSEPFLRQGCLFEIQSHRPKNDTALSILNRKKENNQALFLLLSFFYLT